METREDLEISAKTPVSKYFCYADIFYSAHASSNRIRNECNAKMIPVFKQTGASLDQLREILGRPMTINSWYRCPKLNVSVGGARKSDHMDGTATDFIVSGMSPEDVRKAIISSNFPFDKLITYGGFTHVSHVQPGKAPKFLVGRNGGISHQLSKAKTRITRYALMQVSSGVAEVNSVLASGASLPSGNTVANSNTSSSNTSNNDISNVAEKVSGKYGKLAEYLPIMKEVCDRTGVNLVTMVAQFGLESAYGTRTPRYSDGTPSYNFFGFTATKGYIKNGHKHVFNKTKEYTGGANEHTTRRAFRAYNSPKEGIEDYASLLKRMYGGGFKLSEFKKYATDVKYLTKLYKACQKAQQILTDVYK